MSESPRRTPALLLSSHTLPPHTHNILCLSLSYMHTCTHIHSQWLPFASLLSPPIIFSPPPTAHCPFISRSLHHSFFIPSALQLRLRPGGQPTVMIAFFFALLPELTKYQWLLSKQHCAVKYSELLLLSLFSHDNVYLLKKASGYCRKYN